MADVDINKFRASVVRDGSKPSSPGFIVSEGQDPVNPPGTNNYVPYSGATANVELGEYGVEAGFITLDTTPTNTPTDQGTIFWDADDETVDIVLNGYTMKIGEDLFYPVKNQTGSTIAKGVAVRFNGTVGNSGRLLIAPFIADGSVASSRFMGVTAEEILNGEDGKVLYFGRVRGINTNAFNEGDILYASTTVAGGYQTAIPVAPNNIVQVAAVVTKSATVGTIFVRPTLGSNINKDEGVKIVSVADKNLLQYQSGTSLWENKSLAQVLGGTSAQFVKGDGSLDSTSYQPLLTNPVTGTGTTNYLPKFTGSTTIGNSQVIDNGTELGIGLTPSAGFKLDVGFTGTNRSVLRLSSNAANRQAAITFYGNNIESGTIGYEGGSEIVSGGVQGDLVIRNNLNKNIVLTGNNVLVGTTTDNASGARLQVSGTLTASSTTLTASANSYAGGSLRLNSFTGGTSVYLTANSGFFALSNGGGADHLLITSTGAATFKGDVSITKDNPKLILNDNAGGSQNNYSISSNFGFFNLNDETASGVSVMSYGGGLFNFTGAATFSSSVTANGLFVSGSAGTTGFARFTDSVTASMLVGINSGTPYIHSNNSTLSFGANSSNTFAPTMTLSSGNVGIGIITPQRILTIYDTNSATLYQTPTSGTTANSGFYVGQTGNVSYLYNYNNFPIVLATNNTESIRLFETTQNVHIGPTPASDNGARLQVSGTATFGTTSNGGNVNAFVSSYGNNGLFQSFGIDGALKLQMGGLGTNEAFFYTGPSNFMTFYSGGIERMRISSGGSVGINNTSPVNTAWGNETTTKQLSIDATNYAVINLQGSTGRKYSMGVGDGNFYMCYDNTDGRHNIMVTSGGNVLIGTTTSGSSKLRLVGLPTSATGLSSGDVWNDSGTLKIA